MAIKSVSGGFIFGTVGPSGSLVVKSDADGNVLWANTYAGGGNLADLTTDGAGNIYFIEATTGPIGGWDTHVIKLNSSGAVVRSVAIGSVGNEYYSSIAAVGDQLYLGGQVIKGANGWDAAALKIDANLTTIAWNALWANSGDDSFGAASASEAGILVASTNTASTVRPMHLVQFSPTGSVATVRRVANGGLVNANDVEGEIVVVRARYGSTWYSGPVSFGPSGILWNAMTLASVQRIQVDGDVTHVVGAHLGKAIHFKVSTSTGQYLGNAATLGDGSSTVGQALVVDGEEVMLGLNGGGMARLPTAHEGTLAAAPWAYEAITPPAVQGASLTVTSLAAATNNVTGMQVVVTSRQGASMAISGTPLPLS